MFLISDKIDKEMSTNYEILPEEKTDSTKQLTPRYENKKILQCDRYTSLAVLVYTVSFIALWIVLQLLVTRNGVENAYGPSYFEFDQKTHLMSTKVINDAHLILDTVRNQNNLISNKNKEITTEYLNSLRDVLKKRNEYSIKKLNQLVLDKVQDIENQLAIFERVIIDMVNGNLAVSQNGIANVKAKLTNQSVENAASLLNDAIKQIESEILQLNLEFDQMFSYYGRYINDILYHKTQNITDRMKLVLIADRKLLRGLTWQRLNFCYSISHQNYELSNNLEKIFNMIGKLQNVSDVVNVLSSTYITDENEEKYPLIKESKYALINTLNSTKESFYSMMNTDKYFLGTVLKEAAYTEHIQMRNFMYDSYKTVIFSLIPAIKKATSNFKVVKDTVWQQITNIMNPALTDAGKVIRTKASLITDAQSKNDIIRNSEFKSLHTLMADKFKNASSTVNSIFERQQSEMIEGLSMLLDITMNEKVPLISTWSLQNYIPSDACPMSVDYQTYLKAKMMKYLDQLTNSNKINIPDVVDEVLDLDGNLNSGNNYDSENDVNEKNTDINESGHLFTGFPEEANITDGNEFFGSFIDIINSVISEISNAGFTLDGPVQVYVEGDKKKK